MTALLTNSVTAICQIEQAIGLLRTMITLTSCGSLNHKRFLTCRNKVSDLEIPPALKQKTKSLFDSAARYMQHEEVGAFKFELNLITQLLRRHADEVATKI